MKQHQKALVMKKETINKRKISKTLNELKLVKNINKNSESFLEVSPVQKQVPPSHKLQDHVYE